MSSYHQVANTWIQRWFQYIYLICSVIKRLFFVGEMRGNDEYEFVVYVILTHRSLCVLYPIHNQIYNIHFRQRIVLMWATKTNGYNEFYVFWHWMKFSKKKNWAKFHFLSKRVHNCFTILLTLYYAFSLSNFEPKFSVSLFLASFYADHLIFSW